MSIEDFIRGSQVWKSIFRHPAPRDRRNRVVVMLTNLFLHLHPVSVRKSGIALSYTWCMGGLTFFLFLVETVTGHGWTTNSREFVFVKSWPFHAPGKVMH